MCIRDRFLRSRRRAAAGYPTARARVPVKVRHRISRPHTDRALGAVAQPGGPGSFGRFHIRRSGGRPSGSCRTVDMTQPGPDPDNYPSIDPTEPVPDDPGPLSPDTPETLPPAPVEPMPGPDDPDSVPVGQSV